MTDFKRGKKQYKIRSKLITLKTLVKYTNDQYNL